MSVVPAVLFGALLVCSLPAQDGLKSWLDELEVKGPDASPELIHKVAGLKTRPAMEGLLSIYERVGSVYMRREVVRALATFDGVAEAEQPALEKIASVATGAEEPELRAAAVEALARCTHLGKHFLAVVVDSKAHDDVRIQALRAHLEKADETDQAWYRRIWVPPTKRTKHQPDLTKRAEHQTVRELAFAAVAAKLPEEQLLDLWEIETNPKIRRGALVALHERGSKKAQQLATKVLKRVDYLGVDRAQAAQVLVGIKGPKVLGTFLALAKKKAVTQDDLRQTMARLLVEMDDKTVNKKLAKLVGRGKPHEKVFALLATVHLDDPKLVKKIRKGLEDKSFEVRRATARALAERRDKDAVSLLLAMLAKPREPRDQRVAVEAIGAIQGGDAEWTTRLRALSENSARDVRNEALDQLARSPGALEALMRALRHPDWTTRLVAISGLESLRHKDAIPGLIDALARETGRMKLAVADALWKLAAMPFEGDAARWRAWWDKEGAGFSVVSPDELKAASEKREVRRLSQTTVAKAKFFGIRIISHRVIFIIDTSGSMVEPVPGEFVGKRPATRIEIAKRELLQCIENLDPNALFNIFAFSSGVNRWVPKSLGVTSGHTRAQAKIWIERLGAGGGTNLYDSIKLAFEDPDVDTIFILSDGEPTVGEVVDAHGIREDVRFWNRQRKIEIHTIAVGDSLEVLEWLAKDSGGRHVAFR